MAMNNIETLLNIPGSLAEFQTKNPPNIIPHFSQQFICGKISRLSVPLVASQKRYFFPRSCNITKTINFVMQQYVNFLECFFPYSLDSAI
jgi:hypothetical protein